jgi:hypothetical protein
MFSALKQLKHECASFYSFAQILNNTVFRVLPGFVKRPVEEAWQRNFMGAEWGWRLNIDGLVKRWAGNYDAEPTGE